MDASLGYFAMMPIPGMPGAPFFEGSNITEFLERYGDQCDDAGLKEDEKLKRLTRYCSFAIGQYVKTMPEWVLKDWNGLVKLLLEEYKDQDTFQQMHSRWFLENLKCKDRAGEEDVRQFIRQFTAISAVLIQKGQLGGDTRGILFLDGLPADVREKVITRAKVKIHDPTTIRFDDLAKSATEILPQWRPGAWSASEL